VLFGADLVFPRALPPLGHPDIYRPGLLAALRRLSPLDFRTFVPSHFDVGSKSDFLAAADLYFDADRLVKQYAGEGRTLTDDPERFNGAIDKVFVALDEKYGAWHGGAPMLLFLVQRMFVGEALGF
jgi:glyoxylase-like metal-dependent hydrolase (beta-lactamase superfamily II)